MNPERPKWAERKNPTDAEKILLYDTYNGYCGRYEVNEAEHVMMHLPELAKRPEFTGSHQARPYKLEGDRLTFTAPNPEGPGGTIRLVWEKVK
jgi:hypothetical protein